MADTACLFLILAAFTSTWGGLTYGSLQPVDIFLVGAILSLLVHSVFGRLHVRSSWWITVGALTIFIVGILHVAFPIDEAYKAGRFVLVTFLQDPTSQQAEGWVRGAQWLVAMAGIPILACTLAGRNPSIVGRVALAWTAGAAVSGAVAISDFLHITSVSNALLGYVNATGRSSGLTAHPNTLGVSCAMAMSIAVYYIARRRLLGLAMFVSLAGGVIASGSRAAQVAVVLSLVFTLACSAKTRRRVLPVLLGASAVGIIIAFLSGPAALPDLGGIVRFTDASAEVSDAGRALVLQQGIHDFQYSPIIGVGLEYATSAHNIYIQMAAAGGVLLVCGLLAYFIGAITVGWRVRTVHPLSVHILAALIVWLSAGIASNQLTDRFLYFPVACLAALPYMLPRSSEA
ncbi:O-antigen ligase [Paenarthrobacter nicotinovorans]|uniref:O-antigen ligase family protein n=1 Tax=Paenarthrobacter nicotinovorans TaxID=29320 RepID=UPI0016425D89|nr:O-antigen ligase family protein [Paenarthrobacter nicotinovorans]